MRYSEIQMHGEISRLFPHFLYNRFRYKRYIDILLTHSPVFGVHDEPTRVHQVFKALKMFDKQYKPQYHIHGHTMVRDCKFKSFFALYTNHQYKSLSDSGYLKMALFDDKMDPEVASKFSSDIAFSKAISKAFVQELKGVLLRKSQRLIPFDEVKERLELWYVRDVGIHSVPLDSIVGSQGRYRNFTKHFLPLDENLRSRWKQIDIAVASGKDLPPVELYKVCRAYFVKDGHHRISVAKAKNRRTIEARVFEYDCDVSLDDKTNIEELTLLETYHRFLRETGLKKSRNPELHLTVLGGYPILMEHIQRHRFYLEKKEGRGVTIEDAALSWFDKIYSPLVVLINDNGILKKFPHRTEADFYIWVSKHKNRLFQDTFVPDEARSVIESYSKILSNPLEKMLGKLRKMLGLVKY